MEKGQRTNNDRFKEIFGCKEYDREYTVEKNDVEYSSADKDFQQYFSEFKKYARAYGERNDNIEQIESNLRIALASKISIIENNNSVPIDTEYVCIRDTITNWYITVFSPRFDTNKLSECIESIYANIANTPRFDAGKIGELFRTKDKSDREFLINKEFGSLDVIEDSYYQNAIRNNFVTIIKEICPAYPVDEIKIDFDSFNSFSTLKELIEFLKKIKVDIEQLKNNGFVYSIDLPPPVL